MVLKKGRKKTGAALELIGPALIPAVALTAVPRIPPPQPPTGTPIGLASAVFSASFPGRAMGEASRSGEDGGALSDPESSLYDYQQMEEAGYTTVGFGTWPNQNRKSYSDRNRVPTPPFVRKAGTVGVVSQSGDMYHILDPDEDEASEADLYAIPMKGKGPGRKKGASQTTLNEDGVSLDRTQRDVREAMQAVHDMPVEDTMMRVSQNRQASVSYPGSSSGRGTLRKGESDDGQRSDDGAPPLPPHPFEDGGHQQTEVKEVMEEAYVALREEATPGGSGSGRLSSRRTGTPRDAASFSMEMEVHRLREENHQLHEEVLNLRKVAAAIRVGDQEGAESMLQSHQLDELREENEVLKNAVGRVNQELSRYQAKFRPLSDEDRSRLQGLPADGPVPSWLINKRYLAPLFLAYDDLIQEKEEAMRQCQEELQALKKRTDEVVRENQRLQMKGGGGGGGTGRIDASDWQQLQEQARLVLEENQILIEQLDVQQNKVKDLCSTHVHEVSRLTKRLTTIETEKEEAERELDETRHKYKNVKQRYDKVLLESGSHMTMQDHINNVADLKRSVTEEKEQFDKEKEKMANRLKASDEERNHQTLAAIEVSAENKQLRAEIRALHKALRRSQNKMLIFQKAIQQSENKELITQNELANVIKIVEKTALERDTAFKVVKEQQRDCKDTVTQMVGNSVVMGKMEEKLKMYKMKASAKLQTVAEKLKEQDDSFNRQRQEYEREIRYLRLLVKEKEELINEMEGAKKGVEEDLEMVWQAASSENQRLKDTLRTSVYKLREHPSLRDALDEDEEMERLVHFSE
ncbi:centrosomal protein of 89 kDa-like isoform X2 [Littorina saxatilis]|uniref:centrosomal protein of 89 kDa-like isoform X2 n=1 Tax=Littorina saxatilis TaxID=31220 RepID=UPI0038B5E34C